MTSTSLCEHVSLFVCTCDFKMYYTSIPVCIISLVVHFFMQKECTLEAVMLLFSFLFVIGFNVIITSLNLKGYIIHNSYIVS